MKFLNFAQFNSYIHWLDNHLKSAQLQNIWTNDQEIVLEFYKFKSLWLVISLQSRQPDINLIQDRLPKLKKGPKPVGLFLNSHAKNLRWLSSRPLPELGRVALIQLGNEHKSVQLEVVLVPNAANLLVQLHDPENGDKKISWFKPKDLPQVPTPETSVPEMDWSLRESEWWKALENSKTGGLAPQSGQAGQNKKQTSSLDKKKRALQQLESSLLESPSEKWAALGEELKNLSPQSDYSELSLDSAALVVPTLTRTENMERAFKQAKDLERKKLGAKERIQILQAEIEKLEDSSSPAPVPLGDSQLEGRLKKAQAKTRKLHLAPGVEALCGKSGRDNLSLLRQARAWDLWLHLKDYPGAHAIIFTDKNKVVTAEMIETVSLWLIKESPAARGFSWGGKYEVVVVEARHVRPIKGDSLGRVTYHNPRTFTFASKSI